MSVRVTVKGTENLVRKLQTLKKTQSKKAIRKGSRAGCKLVQAEAKANVPVRTGALRKEIKVRALGRKAKKWTGTQVTTKVEGGPTYYGGFVELGTKKMAARHFIKRAFQSVKGSAEQAFIEGIRSEIDKL